MGSVTLEKKLQLSPTPLSLYFILMKGRVYLAFSPTRDSQWAIAFNSVNAKGDNFGILVFNGKYRRQFDVYGINYEFGKRNRVSGHLVIDRPRVPPTLQAIADFDHSVLCLRRSYQNRDRAGFYACVRREGSEAPL